jgi:hypothetical protein
MTYRGHGQHQQPTSDDKTSADYARHEMSLTVFSTSTSVAIAAIQNTFITPPTNNNVMTRLCLGLDEAI